MEEVAEMFLSGGKALSDILQGTNAINVKSNYKSMNVDEALSRRYFAECSLNCAMYSHTLIEKQTYLADMALYMLKSYIHPEQSMEMIKISNIDLMALSEEQINMRIQVLKKYLKELVSLKGFYCLALLTLTGHVKISGEGC